MQRRALAWCAWIGAWFGAWCVASCGLLAGLLHGWFLLGTTTHYENEEEDLGLGRQIFIGFAPTAPGGNPLVTYACTDLCEKSWSMKSSVPVPRH